MTTTNERRRLIRRTAVAVWSEPRRATLVLLVAASAFSVGLVVARTAHTGSEDYGFLIWNLLLAWMPFLFALWLYDAYWRGRRGLGLLVVGSVWLLFLPNAPYIVTDLVHLDDIGGAPPWYDAGMVAVFASIGLLLALGSLFLVQFVLLDAAGPRLAWACVLTAIGLTSVGVYIGRFMRLNSWDVFSEPMVLLSSAEAFVADPLGAPRFLGVTVVFTAFLAVLHLLLWNVAHVELRLDARRTRQSG